MGTEFRRQAFSQSGLQGKSDDRFCLLRGISPYISQVHSPDARMQRPKLVLAKGGRQGFCQTATRTYGPAYRSDGRRYRSGGDQNSSKHSILPPAAYQSKRALHSSSAALRSQLQSTATSFCKTQTQTVGSWHAGVCRKKAWTPRRVRPSIDQAAVGISNVNRVASPVETTVILPPWAFAISFTINKPRPSPF